MCVMMAGLNITQAPHVWIDLMIRTSRSNS